MSLLIVSIVLSYSLGCFYAFFYPVKYYDEIKAYSSKYNIDPTLVASMINVESSYNENAISSKGARGLMQLMPTTAKWVSEKIGENYEDDYLFQNDYNIKIGCYYLSYLFEQFDGDKDLVVCAYNAGQGNVKNWLKNEEYSSDGKTLKKIPFSETKNYLIKVNKNYHYYKYRYN